MQELYTPKEVAERMKLSYRKVLDMIKSGDLGAILVPGGYRVSEKHLKEYNKKHETNDNR